MIRDTQTVNALFAADIAKKRCDYWIHEFKPPSCSQMRTASPTIPINLEFIWKCKRVLQI
jgi:hypothetical protein